MTDWISQKAAFNDSFNKIQTYISSQLNADITAVTAALEDYIDTSGNNAAAATTIDTKMATIKQWKSKIIELNNSVSNSIKEYASTNDMDSLLQQNGQLQQQIAAAEKRYDELLQDASTADARNRNLRSSDTQISTHQVFLLGRPLRPASIPYLWTLSVLFICTALLLFYYYSPINIPPLYIIITILTDLFYNPWLWICLFGMASIVILFLVLRIVGKI